MKDLNEVLKRFLLRNFLFRFKIVEHITFVTILEHQIDVIDCLFDIDQSNDIVIFATTKHLYLVLK